MDEETIAELQALRKTAPGGQPDLPGIELVSLTLSVDADGETP